MSGAASGIGLAASQRFVNEGASVGMIDVKEKPLSVAAEDLRQVTRPGCKVSWYAVDVSDEGAVGQAVTHLANELGGLDGLVNAAGIDLPESVEETSAAEWDRLFAVNLRGPFLLCKAALPILRQSEASSIVNVASGAALSPIAGRSAYCASKAGLVMFGKALAIEAAPVRVNSVCPGAINTPLLRSSYENLDDPEQGLRAIQDRYVMQRVGEPDEVADAILYLTSEESSYVTGTALAVDGGRTFH